MANKIKNCKNCGKIYLDTGSGICPECVEKEARMEELVLRYVRDNPGVTIATVCEETEVPERIVRRMLRQGRFQSIPGIDFQYPCAKCGAMIESGEYCFTCQRDITAAIVAQQQKNLATGFGQKKKAVYATMGSKEKK